MVTNEQLERQLRQLENRNKAKQDIAEGLKKREMLKQKIWEYKNPKKAALLRGTAKIASKIGSGVSSYVKKVATQPVRKPTLTRKPAGYTVIKKGRKKMRRYYYDKPKRMRVQRQNRGYDPFGPVDFGDDFGGDILRM